MNENRASPNPDVYGEHVYLAAGEDINREANRRIMKRVRTIQVRSNSVTSDATCKVKSAEAY